MTAAVEDREPRLGDGRRGAPTGTVRPDLDALADVLRRALDVRGVGQGLTAAVTAAATSAGWVPIPEAPLRGGGTVDLLITVGGPGATGVGVVIADRGATDALRRRLRRLASHGEVGALVVVTVRQRHRGLERDLDQIPTRVVLIDRAGLSPPAVLPARPSPSETT